jgi:hypothetical protein
MSQNKTGETGKAAGQTRANGNKAVDAAHDAAETGKNAMRDANEQVEHHAKKGMDVALQAVEDSGRRLQSVQGDGSDLASFWLHTLQEQATHNIEAMQQMAGAREWQDKLKVQSAFVSGSLQRLQDVFARYMEMTGNTIHGQVEAGIVNAEKATKATAAA